MSDPVETLVLRARLAAGCSWSSKEGETSNQTEPQEPEVRRILRDCARMLEALKKEANAYAESIDCVRAALRQKETHYLVIADDVKDVVDALHDVASLSTPDRARRSIARAALDKLNDGGKNLEDMKS